MLCEILITVSYHLTLIAADVKFIPGNNEELVRHANHTDRNTRSLQQYDTAFEFVSKLDSDQRDYTHQSSV